MIALFARAGKKDRQRRRCGGVDRYCSSWVAGRLAKSANESQHDLRSAADAEVKRTGDVVYELSPRSAKKWSDCSVGFELSSSSILTHQVFEAFKQRETALAILSPYPLTIGSDLAHWLRPLDAEGLVVCVCVNLDAKVSLLTMPQQSQAYSVMYLVYRRDTVEAVCDKHGLDVPDSIFHAERSPLHLNEGLMKRDIGDNIGIGSWRESFGVPGWALHTPISTLLALDFGQENPVHPFFSPPCGLKLTKSAHVKIYRPSPETYPLPFVVKTWE